MRGVRVEARRHHLYKVVKPYGYIKIYYATVFAEDISVQKNFAYIFVQSKAGMNPKTTQYMMGHSEIGVTLDVYTHLGAGGCCYGASPHGGSPERPTGDEQNKG